MNGGPSGILVVDDEPQVCSLIRDGLASYGLNCVVATDPLEAKRALDSDHFVVMVADVCMPHINGLDLLAYVRQTSRACKVILITGVPNTDYLAKALSLGAYDYFEKPLDMHELLDVISKAVSESSPGQNLSIKAARAMQLQAEVGQASLESIQALVRAVEAKDPYTRRHSEQVKYYAVGLGRHIKLQESAVESIRVASLVHDIGKIGIPDYILTKPGRLTNEEFEQVRQHPLLGAEILENIKRFSNEALLVRYHHENWDGTGYPEGLSGEEIPLGARIIKIADCMDAMLMRRTYKAPYPVVQMLPELTRCAGTQFDPQLAGAAVEWCQFGPQRLILPSEVA